MIATEFDCMKEPKFTTKIIIGVPESNVWQIQKEEGLLIATNEFLQCQIQEFVIVPYENRTWGYEQDH